MGEVAARDLRKETAWRRRLRQQGQSGQAVRAWCRNHRVTETAFYWWRKELARRDAEGRAAAFVPMHVSEEPAPGGAGQIEIVLADGRRVRLSGAVDRQALSAVLDVLERPAC